PVWSHYYKGHLPANKDAAILEIGCGDGAFLFFLHELGFKNACGMDYSAEQISAGERLGIRNMIVGDAQEFLNSAGFGKYDLVIARDVLEHFSRQDAYELLCLVCRTLRPNGKFVMQVPNGEGIFYTSI